MRIVFLAIGDELIRGETLETNGHHLAGVLNATGATLSATHVLPDQMDPISQFFHSLDDCLVITSGGLGPTDDDRSRLAIAQALNLKLTRDPLAEQWIRDLYRRRGRQIAECNYRQADLPQGARPLENPEGTAPGFHVSNGPVSVMALPGVPVEFRSMLAKHLPSILEAEAIQTHQSEEEILRVLAISESELQEILQRTSGYSEMMIRSYPRFPEICLKISSHQGYSAASGFVAALSAHLGWRVFARGEEGSLADHLVAKLQENGIELALAESCTGGLISAMLTRVPGASAVYKGGVVAYSNDIKAEVLGVRPGDLEECGAVSEVVAREMARGVRERMNANLAVSVTGIAGPSGGSDEKPVGTVFMAMSTETDTQCWKNVVTGCSRERFQRHVAVLALGRIWRYLLEGFPEGPGP